MRDGETAAQRKTAQREQHREKAASQSATRALRRVRYHWAAGSAVICSSSDNQKDQFVFAAPAVTHLVGAHEQYPSPPGRLAWRFESEAAGSMAFCAQLRRSFIREPASGRYLTCVPTMLPVAAPKPPAASTLGTPERF